MDNVERKLKIDEFLEKWDEMLEAALQIDDFKFDFGVTITSHNDIFSDRVHTIDGINESFTKRGIGWTSSNR